MIRIITNDNIAVNAHYIAAFAALRHRVFIERLGWELPVTTKSRGLEYDRFDTNKTVYIVVCDDRDAVVAGLRLLKTTEPCVLLDCFPELASGALPTSDTVWEVSRFVADPEASRSTRGAPLATQLLWGLFTYGLEAGLSNFVSVSYAGMERVLRAAGCRIRRLGSPRQFDGRVAVPLALDITEQVLAAIEGRLLASDATAEYAPVEAVIAGKFRVAARPMLAAT